LTACSNCGRELPEGALFCPGCGTSALDFSVARTDISPSHFNSGITATSPPLTTEPGSPFGDPGLVPPPSPSPDEKKPSFFAGKKRPILAIIAVLAVLLVGTTLDTGMLGSGAATAVNSASTPLTGEQLYAAYAANESQATVSYTNKTVYIQDSLDFGVGLDHNTGQYYSSIDSGNVLLFWSSPSQLGQLSAGSMVLARCSVDGEQSSPGAGYVVVLEDCALVRVRSQAASSFSVSVDDE
jgi:hypothetical protein